MKRIIAVIKPNMLDDVIFALHQIESFPGATMTDVRGIGFGYPYTMNSAGCIP
jgi:nitrogen regulatory protein PII